MLNAGKLSLNSPSLTLITIPECVPISPLSGVPESCPVAVSKVAHDGVFVAEKTRVSPSESDAVGVNEYAFATVADVGGVPEITGARFGRSRSPFVRAMALTLSIVAISAPAILCTAVCNTVR